MNRLLATAAGLVMLVGGSGCSLVLVHGPPKDHRERLEIDCTQSLALPIVEGLVGVATTYGVLVARNENNTSRSDAATATMIGAAALVSAVYGYRNVDACRVAQKELQMRRFDAALAYAATRVLSLPPGAPDPWLADGPAPGAVWTAVPGPTVPVGPRVAPAVVPPVAPPVVPPAAPGAGPAR